MKNKLVELISEAGIDNCTYGKCKYCKYIVNNDLHCTEKLIADYLINKGVIVCEYNVGDIIYIINEEEKIEEVEIQKIDYNNADLIFTVVQTKPKYYTPNVFRFPYKENYECIFKNKKDAEKEAK